MNERRAGYYLGRIRAATQRMSQLPDERFPVLEQLVRSWLALNQPPPEKQP